MPVRSLPRLLAAAMAVLLSALAVIGCGSTVTGTASPSPGAQPTIDPVAWMDAVCGSLVPFRDATLKLPELSEQDLPATQRSVSGYLQSAITALDVGTPKLDAAGPSPVPGGEQLTARVKSEINRVRRELTGLKAKIDAANTADRTAFGLVLVDVGRALQQLGNTDPLAPLKSNTELRRAATQAQSCRTLASPIPPATSLPTPTR